MALQGVMINRNQTLIDCCSEHIQLFEKVDCYDPDLFKFNDSNLLLEAVLLLAT